MKQQWKNQCLYYSNHAQQCTQKATVKVTKTGKLSRNGKWRCNEHAMLAVDQADRRRKRQRDSMLVLNFKKMLTRPEFWPLFEQHLVPMFLEHLRTKMEPGICGVCPVLQAAREVEDSFTEICKGDLPKNAIEEPIRMLQQAIGTVEI